MDGLIARAKLAWLALRGEWDEAEALAGSAKKNSRAQPSARGWIANMGLALATRRWMEAFEAEGADPTRDLARGWDLLGAWQHSNGAAASSRQKERWAYALRKRCDAYFQKSNASRSLIQLGELCIEFHEVWQTPLSAESARVAWTLHFKEARQKETYARFLHGLWARSRHGVALSGEDAKEAICSMAINLYELGELASKEGQVLPGHLEMIKMHSSWGFPTDPMEADDLELALDQVCETPDERMTLRAAARLSWAQVALLQAPRRFNAPSLFEKFGVDLQGALRAAMEKPELERAAGCAPSQKTRARRL